MKALIKNIEVERLEPFNVKDSEFEIHLHLVIPHWLVKKEYRLNLLSKLYKMMHNPKTKLNLIRIGVLK